MGGGIQRLLNSELGAPAPRGPTCLSACYPTAPEDGFLRSVPHPQNEPGPSPTRSHCTTVPKEKPWVGGQRNLFMDSGSCPLAQRPRTRTHNRPTH